MQQITEGLWTVPAPLTFFGLQLNTRMTVCQLSDGGLVLISPVGISESLTSAIDGLGPVRGIVSPNLLHHLYLGEWIEAYPNAVSYGPPGLADKRPNLVFNYDLGSEFDEVFGTELERIFIAGMPKLNESMFLHRQSGTLIATDFCFFMPEAKGFTGLFARVMGIIKRTRCEPLFRILIKDKAAFRHSLKPLRSVEIQHLSMCHHCVISEGASKALEQVLDQLKIPLAS